jgi:hypothetical protein
MSKTYKENKDEFRDLYFKQDDQEITSNNA